MNKEIIKLISNIQELAILVSNFTVHDVFVNYLGHVNKISVTAILDGYKKDVEFTNTVFIDAYLDREINIVNKLKETEKALSELLEVE